MKYKKKYFKSLNKELFKGFNRFYWFLYTEVKYYYYKYKFKDRNESKQYKISLLLPSRERSKKFKRMLDSLISTCSNISRIELLILLDTDDKEKILYESILSNNKYSNLNHKIYLNNLSSHAKRNNFLAMKSVGDILFPINDDITFISKHWDKEIDNEFSKVVNQPYCLWVDSGQKYLYLHSDFPIVNKEWYKKLGYIGSEFFNFWYLDTWICDLCHRSKKFLISKKIKLYQYSAHTIKEEVDNTHLKNIKNDIPLKDKIIWNETVGQRIKDARLLV